MGVWFPIRYREYTRKPAAFFSGHRIGEAARIVGAKYSRGETIMERERQLFHYSCLYLIKVMISPRLSWNRPGEETSPHGIPCSQPYPYGCTRVPLP